jgi:thioredoxin reductase (NADPH)
MRPGLFLNRPDPRWVGGRTLRSEDAADIFPHPISKHEQPVNELEMVSSEDRLDLAVVGAGPCGLAVGVAAARAGLKARLFDRGCVVNAIVGYPIDMTFFSTPEKLEVGDVPFVTAAAKPGRSEALTYYRRVARHFDLDVRQYQEVVGVEGHQGDFTLLARRKGVAEAHCARHVVVATGYFGTPKMLDVPGEELPKVSHYYREAHPFYDQDCLVIGGGNSAVEAALDLWRAGARVTLVHIFDDLDVGVKPWVRPDIENRIREGSIAAHFRTRVLEISPERVLLRHEAAGGDRSVANDWVFAMTGFTPDNEFLRRLGIDVDEKTGVPTYDPTSMETNVPGIFVAGVLVSGYDTNRIFIENGRHHGDVIVKTLQSGGASGSVSTGA